jgi:hypothetical protein
MEQIYTQLITQFPVLGAVGLASYFITRYISQTQKENNARYDSLDNEYKSEMKESNKTLIDLTSRSISALEKSVESSEALQQSVTILMSNQVLIKNQTDKIK